MKKDRTYDETAKEAVEECINVIKRIYRRKLRYFGLADDVLKFAHDMGFIIAESDLDKAKYAYEAIENHIIDFYNDIMAGITDLGYHNYEKDDEG